LMQGIRAAIAERRFADFVAAFRQARQAAS